MLRNPCQILNLETTQHLSEELTIFYKFMYYDNIKFTLHNRDNISQKQKAASKEKQSNYYKKSTYTDTIFFNLSKKRKPGNKIQTCINVKTVQNNQSLAAQSRQKT